MSGQDNELGLQLGFSYDSKACLFLAGPDHMEHLKRIVEKMQKQVLSRPRSRMATMF
jgi:hypothetical protein